MPLIVAPANVELRIQKVMTDDRTRRHLESLGLTVDSPLRVISVGGGSSIIEVKGGRLALDRTVTNRIFVTVI